jgi:hypothetical protein
MNDPVANCFRFAKIEHRGMVARAQKGRRIQGKSAITTSRVPHPCRAATEPALSEVEGLGDAAQGHQLPPYPRHSSPARRDIIRKPSVSEPVAKLALRLVASNQRLLHRTLDFIGDVRNHLHGLTEIIAPAPRMRAPEARNSLAQHEAAGAVLGRAGEFMRVP